MDDSTKIRGFDVGFGIHNNTSSDKSGKLKCVNFRAVLLVIDASLRNTCCSSPMHVSPASWSLCGCICSWCVRVLNCWMTCCISPRILHFDTSLWNQAGLICLIITIWLSILAILLLYLLLLPSFQYYLRKYLNAVSFCLNMPWVWWCNFMCLLQLVCVTRWHRSRGSWNVWKFPGLTQDLAVILIAHH